MTASNFDSATLEELGKSNRAIVYVTDVEDDFFEDHGPILYRIGRGRLIRRTYRQYIKEGGKGRPSFYWSHTEAGEQGSVYVRLANRKRTLAMYRMDGELEPSFSGKLVKLDGAEWPIPDGCTQPSQWPPILDASSIRAAKAIDEVWTGAYTSWSRREQRRKLAAVPRVELDPNSELGKLLMKTREAIRQQEHLQ